MKGGRNQRGGGRNQRTNAQTHENLNIQEKACSCPDLSKNGKGQNRVVRDEKYCTYLDIAPKVLVVAEAPGVEEDKVGRPFWGISGQEARYHMDINGITAAGAYLTNLVCCHPPGNRDPTAEEIHECTSNCLIPTILKLKPKWIITMGRISTRWFLGDVDMEMVHGIPRSGDFRGLPVVVIPTYHPAAGLHSPEQMILFQCDMKVAGGVIRGEISPHPPQDGLEPVYREVKSPEKVLEIWEGRGDGDLIAIDTEWAKNRPWCLSFSVVPGEAHVIMVGQRPALDALNSIVNYEDTTTVIQNALYDLPVLAEMGIQPRKTADTMVLAYLLQDEPQGLKPLAFRHCGMVMSSYQDMVLDFTREKTLEYMETIMLMDWPDPDLVLEWKKGEPHVRQPQNIKRKVKRVLSDIESGKNDKPFSSWKKMSDTGQIEDVLGVLEEADLSDVPWDDAIHYSARDADATLRIYPILWERIDALGLGDTFWRDMRALPMVVSMMANGMPVSLEAFTELSEYFQGRMDLVQRRIQYSVGKELEDVKVNPASYQQMSTLIYDRLRLHERGGNYRSKKGAVKKSTANEILKRYTKLHPVVEDIIQWREYQKLKTSYSDAIPRLVSSDDRIRTTLRITRVATGRLSSSKPNLMAQPIRSEEGRKIRDCYVAPEGSVLMSGDYSQVEMRVAAENAKDETMMGIFWSGQDIHSITASEMFGVPIPQLNEMKHRYPAKRVGFGILNLITAEGLQRELAVGGADEWTLSDCEEMIRSWFGIYSGIAAYMKANGEQAKRLGYVRDMWGRIRYVPGIRSVNQWVRIEAERQAGNAPIQMGAQGVIKEAMGRLVPVYRELGIKPLIQIHDDIVWEMEEEMVEEAVPRIKKIMEGSAPDGFIVPLNVDFKVGRKWGSLEKLEDWKGGR